ncbi:MAG: hypothetical protein HKM02_02725 [Pseudomonadales bacterium]|nr:hypothetical protein [Pseudomonadales bacterium]
MSHVLWTRHAEHQLRHICRLYAQQGYNPGFVLDQVQMLCQRLASGGPDHPVPGIPSYAHACFDRYRLIYRRRRNDVVVYTIHHPSFRHPVQSESPKHREAVRHPHL